jgi:hypothetical protein
VALDDPFYRGKTDAVPCALIRFWQALEGDEKMFRIRHAEAGAVVTDEESRRSVNFSRAEFYWFPNGVPGEVTTDRMASFVGNCTTRGGSGKGMAEINTDNL